MLPYLILLLKHLNLKHLMKLLKCVYYFDIKKNKINKKTAFINNNDVLKINLINEFF